MEKTSTDSSNFVDRCVEGFFVCLGRLVKAADLPDELQRGVANLCIGHGWIEVEEVADVPAHGEIIGRAEFRFRSSERLCRGPWRRSVGGRRNPNFGRA